MTTVKPNLQAGLSKLKKWWDEEDRVLRCTLPFQRQAGVWNQVTKSNLVWSILSDGYVPPVVLLRDKSDVDERGKDTYIYEILDGQQRLTSMFSFMDDEWTLHADTPPITFENFPFDIAGRKFSELEEELQNAISQFRFSLQCFENYTMEEAESLFFHINSGVGLSAVQKSKAKMGTDMVSYFNDLLGGTFFTSAVHVTDAQEKREEKLLMLIQSVLLLDNRQAEYPYKTIAASFCQKYAEGLRNNYGDLSRLVLSETIDYLGEAFQATNKFLRKNNVPVVVVMGKVALEQKIEPQDFRLFINDFANAFYPSYESASGSGNVKAKQVQMRLRVMFLAFCKYFHLDAGAVRAPFSEEIDLYEGIVPDDGLFPGDFSEDGADSENSGGLTVPEIFSGDEKTQTEGEPFSSEDADTDKNETEADKTHEEG